MEITARPMPAAQPSVPPCETQRICRPSGAGCPVGNIGHHQDLPRPATRRPLALEITRCDISRATCPDMEDAWPSQPANASRPRGTSPCWYEIPAPASGPGPGPCLTATASPRDDTRLRPALVGPKAGNILPLLDLIRVARR